jgi:signal transduction histidine kinase/CheY-like chemotaxis protein
MIPSIVLDFLQSHREEKGCFCLELDEKLQIKKCFSNPEKLGLPEINSETNIFDLFPFLITETFDSNFEIPFFNINPEHVCNIYFLKANNIGYIILVDKSEIFQITQKYQQFAHEDNISKNKFKRLAEELERAKLKLNESNQQKATLIAMLSHELGTPLTSIMGYSELLMKNEIDPEKGASIINRNATDLMLMIENTLLFGRSEAGGQQINLQQCNLAEFFDELVSTLKPTIHNSNVKIEVAYKGNEIINIDIPRVRQILLNLLSNAIKYTIRGVAEIGFKTQKDKYVFSIKDSGIGIPTELQQAIFNPWKRLNETNTKGAGIGLIISQSLAKTMDGEVILKYSTPAVGSIFELIIPTNSQSETLNEPQLSQLAIEGKSILVIDDDHDVLELIDVLLHPLNIKLYSSQNLNNAKQIIKSNAIDIILTDYHIGYTKASDLIEYLNFEKIKIPVLLMTALPSNSLRKRFESSGFEIVISKPLNSDVLINSILKTVKNNE